MQVSAKAASTEAKTDHDEVASALSTMQVHWTQLTHSAAREISVVHTPIYEPFIKLRLAFT